MDNLYAEGMSLMDALRQAVQGRVIQSGDEDYEACRQVWNRAYDRHPYVIVVPQGVSDVVAAVRFAKAQGLLIAVRSGGHHVAGLGSCDDGVVVDMSDMRSVVVNPTHRTAMVQGGATARDVIRETQLFGLAVPTGNVGAVGIAGLTTGGGMGYLRRQYGLTCDSLIAVDVVLADGTFVHASQTEHSDLLWAIRGGGGNFGIVTALYFTLYPVGPTVVGIHTMYAAEDASRVLYGCREFLEQCGTEVSINIDVAAIPPLPFMPPELVGRRVIIVNGMNAEADLEKAAATVQPLRELATPLMDGTGPVDYAVLHGRLDAMLPPEHRGHVESLYVQDLSDRFLDQMVEIVQSAKPGNLIMVWPLGGQMAYSDAQSSAFGDRSAAAVVMLEAMWQESSGADDGIAWAKRSLQQLEAFGMDGATYLNLVGSPSEDVVQNTYGDNFAKLRALKRQYDPNNVFRFNLNINPDTEVVDV